MAQQNPTGYLRAATSGGLQAVTASLLLSVVIVVAAGGASSFFGVLIAALRVWLVAIGAAISVGETDVTAVPIGAWLLAVGLIALVIAKRVPGPVDSSSAFVASTGGIVGVAAALAAGLSSTEKVEVGLVRAACCGFLIGSAGAAVSLWRRDQDSGRFLLARPDLSIVVFNGLRAAAIVLGASAATVAVLLIAHRDRASELWALADPGAGGTVVLALSCLLAIPNVVLWTASAFVGPGFTVGTDTSVDLTGAHLGAVPGFPVLAVLPPPGPFDNWVFILGLVPLLAGAYAGYRSKPAEALGPRVAMGAAAGAFGGFVLGVLMWASGGSIGPGRMSQVGPDPIGSLLSAIAVLALGGAIGAALAHYRDERAT